MDLAPIILFAYNRPQHTLKTLEALSNNSFSDQSDIYIYCDGPKKDSNEEVRIKIQEVRKVIRQKQWCKKVNIIERDQNWGLTQNIVDGVTHITQKYGKAIIIEDDIVTSTGFLKFMNEALHLYEEDKRVMQISGYMYPIKYPDPNSETFFFNVSCPWGWGTWDRAWQHLNLDLDYLLKNIKNKKRFNIDGNYQFFYMLKEQLGGDWDLKWYASIHLQNGICLYPKETMVQNIGWDGSGVHCDDDPIKQIESINLLEEVAIKKLPIQENQIVKNVIKKYFRETTSQPSLVSRVKWGVIDYLTINMGLKRPLIKGS